MRVWRPLVIDFASGQGLFTLGGFVAAFVAGSPIEAETVADLIVLVILRGAGISPSRFLLVALPPLGFF